MATITGTNGFDWLVGTGSADTIKGLDDNDILKGGGGDDRLEGGSGADRLDGGRGMDTASYRDSPTGVTVSLLTGATFGGHAGGDVLTSIENIDGSDHSDVLLGDDGPNTIDGFEGHNTLKGYGGADRLYGGNGSDTLVGMDGNDQLVAWDGRDVLNGGPGADHMYGGQGADTFLYASIGDLGLTVATTDWILDLYFHEGDRIDLGLIDADVYTPGDQAFRFIGTAPFSGTPGEIRYYQVGDETFFELQTGTSVDIEGLIRIGSVQSTPEASWFVL
jgi:Ca2+-binding RTX toxin-like protein